MFSYQIINDYFCVDEDMRKQAPSNTLIDSKEFLNQNLKKLHKVQHGNSMYQTNLKDGNPHENEQIDTKMFFTHYVQQWNIRN